MFLELLRLKLNVMQIKNLKYVLAILITSIFSGAFAQQTAKITNKGVGYLQYLPDGYSSNTNKYPVVISLHGIKEKGTTSTDPATVLAGVWTVANVGIPKYIKYGQKYPFIVIAPQLKSNYGTWPASYVMDVINYVKTTLRIDEKKIYLSGLSLGGYGVWTTAGAYPGVFAAINPICSGGNDLSHACAIAAENVPVWAFHGDADYTVNYTVTTKMVSAINACAIKPNPLAKVTIYPGMSHVIWDKVYKESGIFNWMLSFTNGTTSTTTTTTTTTTTNALPTVSAGSDKYITLPTNSTYMQGSASDSDGIASWQWSKISGGAAVLSGTTSSKLTASGLVAGSYVFRLTVKDTKGASRYDDVNVTVASSTTTNTAPIVNAGSDRTLILPSNYTYLPSTATDSDGIASYSWAKLSGGSAYLQYATSYRLRVSNLAAGTYVFRVTVKDGKGATSYDDVTVIVKS
jgi:dienelactone hydrolase